ncbi:hypothetical protein OTU49_009639 [Cherax quadricarinatus]|uniref:HTH La-type RNA-binding domain-containing protein n=1 Tax=Cherax quadricarinatus TaxID=27406 RepID=A0AAW0WIT2_CHEQU
MAPTASAVWSKPVSAWPPEGEHVSYQRCSDIHHTCSSSLERRCRWPARYNSPSARCSSPSARCSSPSARCSSPSARCSSPSARCSSPSARCSSPSARCSSPSARCSSPSARCNRVLARCNSSSARYSSPSARCRRSLSMSDADTEGSSGPWRQMSFTSSESDGPRVVIPNKSEEEGDGEEEEETDENSQNLKTSMMGVKAAISMTTTDRTSGESGQPSHFDTLTPELEAALVKQLEDYFSDAGLARDLFLLKHVKRHKDGFVSLKLLSGYKKIKKLSRRWQELAAAARASTMLQVNEEGTKVRRRTPLPPNLLYEAPTSRAIVAVNVPPEQATVAALATLFGRYGSVASLQVLRPRPGGNVVPELQSLLVRTPEVATTTCAVVEYEDVWGAGCALREGVNLPMTLHLLRRSRRASPSSSRSSPTPTPKGRHAAENGVSADELRQRLKSGRSKQRHTPVESTTSDGEESGSGRAWWRSGPRHLTPQPAPRPVYHALVGCSKSTPTSPASYRRTDYPLSVTRYPRGPDDNRGFSRFRS